MRGDPLLLQVFRQPRRVLDLEPAEWNRLILEAQDHRLLARLSWHLDDHGLLQSIPDRAKLRLKDATVYATFNQGRIRFEVNRIQRALIEAPSPVLLLKGGAYIVAGLAFARGRVAGDLDIMVSEELRFAVRDALLAAGWRKTTETDYDEHYYQTWMHELSPLLHAEREMVTDVHHTIAPPTSRVRPNIQALWDSAIEVAPGLKILGPTDMVLHAAVHLFNEDCQMGFRDLLDLHDLMRLFGQDEAFWTDLCDRARQHGLQRVLYHLLDCTADVLQTPIPESARQRANTMAPSPPVRMLMRVLLRNALTPTLPAERSWISEFALWLLFVRSHWLRMPPLLLFRHLSTKTWFRMRRWALRPATR